MDRHRASFSSDHRGRRIRSFLRPRVHPDSHHFRHYHDRLRDDDDESSFKVLGDLPGAGALRGLGLGMSVCA